MLGKICVRFPMPEALDHFKATLLTMAPVAPVSLKDLGEKPWLPRPVMLIASCKTWDTVSAEICLYG